MNQLIKIDDHNGKSVVSARELHAFLESGQDFSNWILRRIKKYRLVENEDYTTFNKFVERENSNLKSKTIEYALTLDTAKELSMVEANEKGRQARRYFIERDKQLSKVQEQVPLMIDAVVEKVLQRLEADGKIFQLEPPEPKVKYFSVSEYIREYKCIPRYFSKWDIMGISNDAKRMCKENDIEIIKRSSDMWESGINTYPEPVLEIVVEDFLRPF